MTYEPAWLDRAIAIQPRLWLTAVLFYGVGDGVLTAVGIWVLGAAEVGPIAAPVLEHGGIGGLVGLKVVFFVVFIAAWLRMRTPGRVAIPLSITLVGVLVTAWNVLVVISHL